MDALKEKTFAVQKTFFEAAGLAQANQEEISTIEFHNVPDTGNPELKLFRNEFYELTIGKGLDSLIFAIDGKEYPATGAPFICFIAPNQLQSYTFTSQPTGAHGYAIYASKKTVKSIENKLGTIPFFRRSNKSYYHISLEQYDALCYWAKYISETEDQNPLTSHALKSSFLTVLLAKANELLPTEVNELLTKPQSVADSFLELVAANKAHQPAKYYADRLALTTKRLNVILKQVLNKTATQVIQDATVTQAKALLLQTNKNVSEIAFELGFDELSNFSRLFKRLTALLPDSFSKQDNLISFGQFLISTSRGSPLVLWCNKNKIK